MFKSILSLSCAAMLLTVVSAASASDYCESFGRLHEAMADGTEFADMAYEDAVSDCEGYLSYESAMSLADVSGALGIEQVAGGWQPIAE